MNKSVPIHNDDNNGASSLNAEHTPTPWRRHYMEHDAIVGLDRKAIALVMGKSRSDEEDAANLAHILRCVNSHDDLVAALEYAESWISHTSGEIPEIRSAGTYERMLAHVRSALKYARQ